MKLLASALALVLVGLASVWLWFDATVSAEQDTAGVVITTEAPAGQPGGPLGPTSSVRPAAPDQGGAPTTTPTPEGNDALQREVDSARQEEDQALAAAALVAVLGRAADETVTAAASALTSAEASSEPVPATPEPAPAPAPQPVQPAPVSPGLCWDDDEWEECDDDWDDDDRDDDDRDD